MGFELLPVKTTHKVISYTKLVLYAFRDACVCACAVNRDSCGYFQIAFGCSATTQKPLKAEHC